MMTDIGKGDVVAAIHDMSVSVFWAAPGHGPYVIAAGQRAIVAEVCHAGQVCTGCGATNNLTGLILEEYPMRPCVAWCPCEWKKLGPSQDETVAQFAKHLIKQPNRTPETVG